MPHTPFCIMIKALEHREKCRMAAGGWECSSADRARAAARSSPAPTSQSQVCLDTARRRSSRPLSNTLSSRLAWATGKSV